MSLNSVPFNLRLAKKVVTHHIHHSNSEVKVTVKYFTKQGTIYDVIKKYSTYHTTDFPPNIRSSIKNLRPAAEDTDENCREQDWSQPTPA